MAPSERPLSEVLQGRRVIVEAQSGQRFEGNLECVQLPERHVIIRDARELPAETRYPSDFAAHVEWIVPVDETIEITEVEPTEVSPGPFAATSLDPRAHGRLLERVAERGGGERFPVVRPVDGGFQVVTDHLALWAAEQVRLTTYPVIVERLSPAEQAARFAFDHFPLPHHLEADDATRSGRYTDVELHKSIEQYLDVLGDAALDLFPVRYNADRLDSFERKATPSE